MLRFFFGDEESLEFQQRQRRQGVGFWLNGGEAVRDPLMDDFLSSEDTIERGVERGTRKAIQMTVPGNEGEFRPDSYARQE